MSGSAFGDRTMVAVRSRVIGLSRARKTLRRYPVTNTSLVNDGTGIRPNARRLPGPHSTLLSREHK